MLNPLFSGIIGTSGVRLALGVVSAACALGEEPPALPELVVWLPTLSAPPELALLSPALLAAFEPDDCVGAQPNANVPASIPTLTIEALTNCRLSMCSS